MTTLTSFDNRQLRDVLGSFTTGVTVVTTRDKDGTPHGVTANSFSSVSLDPPLVLWSQALLSKSYPAFRDSEHFGVNILAENQVALSNHFARSQFDKFSGTPHSLGLGGVPILEGVSAHLECVKVAAYPGGDHVIYMGRVERIKNAGRRPLAFMSGRYMVPYAHDLGPVSLHIGSPAPDQLEAVRLATDRLAALAEEVGQHTVGLGVWGNHGPTAIRWEPSNRPMNSDLRAGLVMSITRTALGRTFAAFLPSEMTKPFLEEDLRLNRTPGQDSAVQREEFDEVMVETRRERLARAVSNEPSPLNPVAITAFGAPIFNSAGNMVAALSIVSASDRLPMDWNGPAPRRLGDAAKEITQELAELHST